jgi:hypothetical protein
MGFINTVMVYMISFGQVQGIHGFFLPVHGEIAVLLSSALYIPLDRTCPCTWQVIEYHQQPLEENQATKTGTKPKEPNPKMQSLGYTCQVRRIPKRGPRGYLLQYGVHRPAAQHICAGGHKTWGFSLRQYTQIRGQCPVCRSAVAGEGPRPRPRSMPVQSSAYVWLT